MTVSLTFITSTERFPKEYVSRNQSPNDKNKKESHNNLTKLDRWIFFLSSMLLKPSQRENDIFRVAVRIRATIQRILNFGKNALIVSCFPDYPTSQLFWDSSSERPPRQPNSDICGHLFNTTETLRKYRHILSTRP